MPVQRHHLAAGVTDRQDGRVGGIGLYLTPHNAGTACREQFGGSPPLPSGGTDDDDDLAGESGVGAHASRVGTKDTVVGPRPLRWGPAPRCRCWFCHCHAVRRASGSASRACAISGLALSPGRVHRKGSGTDVAAVGDPLPVQQLLPCGDTLHQFQAVAHGETHRLRVHHLVRRVADSDFDRDTHLDGIYRRMTALRMPRRGKGRFLPSEASAPLWNEPGPTVCKSRCGRSARAGRVAISRSIAVSRLIPGRLTWASRGAR